MHILMKEVFYDSGKLVSIFLIIVLFSPLLYAHEGEDGVIEENIDLAGFLSDLSLIISVIGGILVVAFGIISIKYEKKLKKYKKLLFLTIVIPAVLVTIFLVVSTLYTNASSKTKGPIHWHADFEIWNCGEKMDLVDPEGFSNRVGSSVFHEHGDDRIHVEGVVVDESDVDLHNFFSVIGGDLDKDRFIIPTNKGVVEIKNGESCTGKKGILQVFVYEVVNAYPSQKSGFIFEQRKLENFGDYIISPYANVPPGDCIIIEFDKEKEKTDRLCGTYKLGLQKGDMGEESHGS